MQKMMTLLYVVSLEESTSLRSCVRAIFKKITGVGCLGSHIVYRHRIWAGVVQISRVCERDGASEEDHEGREARERAIKIEKECDRQRNMHAHKSRTECGSVYLPHS